MIAPHLRALSRLAAFRALLRVRLVGQVSDGLLQAGLVGVVLFAPERAPSPTRIAVGFAVLLLPFCLVAPIAGVLLDRWSRVRVLAWANLARALLITVTAVATAVSAPEVVIFGSALVALGLNRFILAALGASLPRTVSTDLLVSGNALAPTLGTAATVAGAGIGLALRGAFDAAGDAAPFAAAALGYLLAVLATGAFTHDALGPVESGPDNDREGRLPRPNVLASSWADISSGVTHVAASAPATRALTVMAANRLLFGAFTVWTVIVIRFQLHGTSSDEESALAALAAVALAVGLGLLAAALSAPVLVRRRGARSTATVALTVAAFGALIPLVAVRLWAFLVAWLLLSAGAQMLKITVDTILQRAVDDDMRGRVFIAYDIVFNVAFVLGAATVAALPMSSLVGAGAAAIIGAGYLLLAGAACWPAVGNRRQPAH
ncbi:MAG: MFS transporter [Actinomycetia bacterium]|nr:MFS transporter [Actinomycetes bacterium]